jgi:hypothetical protein
VRAVLLTALMMLIAYMGRSGSPGVVSRINATRIYRLGGPT